MSVVFDRVSKVKRGYRIDQVDDFMTRARTQVDDPQRLPLVSAEDVRSASFSLQHGGYDIAHIDAALARLETVFARVERAAAIDEVGQDAWIEQTRERARIVLARLRRPEGQRFRRAGFIRFGYDIAEVDAVCDRIEDFLTRGGPLTADEIRETVFSRRRNGYAEWQVDLVLDRVISIILAIAQ